VTSLLFFPDNEFPIQPKDVGLIAEDVFFCTTDGLKLNGWYFSAPTPANGTILLFHGNAGNISNRLLKAKGWLAQGYNVFLIDYRSYGLSEGHIDNEAELYLDAEASLAWLKDEKKIPSQDIVLYGESLGSSIATEMATRQPFKGLLLESPFSSLREVAKQHYAWAPVALMEDFLLDNLSKIDRIQAPFFWIHGTADEICPYPLGKALYQKAHTRKEKLIVEGGHHNDLPDAAGILFFTDPAAFFNAASAAE